MPVTAGTHQKVIYSRDFNIFCPSGGMVDAADSKSAPVRGVGSSPTWGTKDK